MKVQQNFDLKPFNTFGLPVKAKYWLELNDAAQLPQVCALAEFEREQVLWLGGGSNVLFDGDYPALVVHIANKGVREIRRENGKVWLQAEAGEIWHDFVLETLNRGLSGLENLSLIPGTVGASPVQNIGAYGVEVKDVIDSVRCFELDSGRFVELSNAECEFAYRESVFKQAAKGRYVIVAVTFILNEQFELKARYGDLAAVLQENCGNRAPEAKDVSQAVCQIRSSKLPDPAVLGNVGSFFKNPVVSAEAAEKLLATYPQMPHYPQADGSVKLAAGWLIDQCGLKGYRIGGAAVHDKQALVLVNQDNASAENVRDLEKYIQDCVKNRFGVALQAEPNWLP